MIQKQYEKPVFPLLDHLDEQVLVVKREIIFKNVNAWHGVYSKDSSEFLKLIEQEKEFIPREKAEVDASYKQIIPYLIFTHDNKYFLMQRRSEASEQRLKNKLSLGIGGHIRLEDLVQDNSQDSKDSIVNWAKREFDEEINYSGNYSVKPVGIVNDDTNPVGEVHLGFVFLLIGDSNKISVKSELKSGELLTKEECLERYNSMETWSQLVFDLIKENKI